MKKKVGESFYLLNENGNFQDFWALATYFLETPFLKHVHLLMFISTSTTHACVKYSSELLVKTTPTSFPHFYTLLF